MSAPSFKVLSLSAILAVVAVAPMQGQFARQFFSLSGGAAYSSLTNYNVSSDWHWGGTAGASVGVLTFDYSYVELAPAWVQVGGEGINLNYIDIPLLLGGLFPLGGLSTYGRAYAGVDLGVKLTCKTDVALACEAAKGTVWTLPVGLSILRMVGGGRFIGVDARYSFGLSDVFDLTQAKQRSWQFRAVFGATLGGR